LDSLQRSLPYAAERADYQAFMAALLQRQNRHPEAIEHYRQALRKAPENGLWWMGVGISLRAAARPSEARDAFERAAASNALSPQLRAFVEQQAQQLGEGEH
jgi:MSHA biogenesis protein MshN